MSIWTAAMAAVRGRKIQMRKILTVTRRGAVVQTKSPLSFVLTDL
jgi:hypothetical protein